MDEARLKRLVEIASLSSGVTESLSKAGKAIDDRAELHWLRMAAANQDEATKRLASFIKAKES